MFSEFCLILQGTHHIYPTYALAEILFELSESNLHNWFVIGLDILEETVKKEIPLPAENQKVRSLRELYKKIPELKEHITDAFEQPLNRPKYNQQEYYSGKKKMHTRKRQIIVGKDKKIISISNSYEGKKHDFDIAKESKYWTHAPPDSIAMVDLGFNGLDKVTDMKVILPYKKPPKKELNDYQKDQNRGISSVRVRVEHVIAHIKFYKILSHKIRYRSPIDNSVANAVAGLYNFTH